MGVSNAAGDAIALSYALAQVDDLATALAAYDAIRRGVGNEIAAWTPTRGVICLVSALERISVFWSADDRCWREAAVHTQTDTRD